MRAENRLRKGAWLLVAGMASLFTGRIARAQPSPEKVVKLVAQPPKVAVFTKLSAQSQSQSRLDLTVLTEPRLEQPPSIFFLRGRRAVPRSLKATRDDKTGAWVAVLDEIESYGMGLLRIEIAGAKQIVEQHVIEFALSGLDENIGSSLHSANGRFAIFLPHEGATKEARFLITSHEQPAAPLPEGAKLEAGPFEVSAMGQAGTGLKAVVAIHLGTAQTQGDKIDYQILRWNGEKRSWNALPSGLDGGGRTVQAQVEGLGTFVLTSRVP